MATNGYLKAKLEERASQAQVLEDLQKTAADQGRDLTEPERKTFDGLVERLGFLDSEIERVTRAAEGAAKFMDVYGAHKEAEEKTRAARERERERRPARRPVQERAQSLGHRFVTSEQFRRYSGHGTSEPFTIEASLEERAFTSEGTFEFGEGENIMTGGLEDMGWPVPMQWAGPRQPELRTPLYDVIGRVPTTAGSIEYWYSEPPDLDNMADEVEEGEEKPEATIRGEVRAMPVKTYAWWKGITRQALDDIPMIQALVDNHLRRGVVLKIASAAATALLADTNIPTTGGGELLAAMRVALGMLDEIGYSANAVALNPMDWAALDTSLLAVLGTMSVTGQQAFWGLRPVASGAIPSGTAYVGDFSEGMTYFDRRQVQLFMTDSHSDYFIRNKLVLLAEARGRVVVSNAGALVKCTGSVPGGGGGGNGNGNGGEVEA